MVSITLTIPGAVANRFLDAFALRKGYTGFLSDGVTPHTKVEFLKSDLIRYAKNAVSEQESKCRTLELN